MPKWHLKDRMRARQQISPNDFMFKLSEKEWEEINRNILSTNMRSQIVTTPPNKRNKSNPPYAFTEHGAVPRRVGCSQLRQI